MFITKLGHSCVLVETPDRVGLFDPGVWSEHDLIAAVKHVDRIVYSHEHADHFDLNILQKVLARFPDVHVVCNEVIKAKIQAAGLHVTVREETECCRKFVAPHEQLPIPGAITPSQNGYHFQESYTHPGDSQNFSESKAVLAMPFIGPWGKTGDSVTKVLELKPKYVLAVHDWHYTAEAKEWLQSLLQEAFKNTDTQLLPNNIGERLEISL